MIGVLAQPLIVSATAMNCIVQLQHDLTVHEAPDPVPLLRGLEADEVHAALPAVVPRVEPAPAPPRQLEVGVEPAEVVVVVPEPLHSSFAHSWGQTNKLSLHINIYLRFTNIGTFKKYQNQYIVGVSIRIGYKRCGFEWICNFSHFIQFYKVK